MNVTQEQLAKMLTRDGFPLSSNYDDEWYWMNSVGWWRQHWQRYPEVEVERAEPLPGGWDLWTKWSECLHVTGLGRSREETADELQQLRADGGRYLGFVRLVARRRQPA